MCKGDNWGRAKDALEQGRKKTNDFLTLKRGIKVSKPKQYQ